MPDPVHAAFEPLTLPTYPVGTPERNPVFFERRVYQGSNGKVYPVPFIDRVHDVPVPVTYRSVKLENEYVRLVLLPEIGGRLLVAQDRTNRDYDFFYRQDVIKPALVGLAGPWISGGVEFNWPQHHRPGTFLPSEAWIEEEADGARTVWMSEHDPISHLRGLHGFRLRPGSALIELRVRLCNRTPVTQTFLWWANVAARVHGRYQSFFPPDVHYVADHAVRAQSSFPLANNPYYGVRYDQRPGANDLRWYRNIPVPTSYMIGETAFDFLGGYDHEAEGGFVQVANRHIAPGKKQWTWGDHAFGHAWDRELTDHGGPYIELMSGVFTDNQPDFSYLAPQEVRAFSQFWWPLQQTGPVQAVSERAALRLDSMESGDLALAAAVSAPLPGAHIVLREGDRTLLDERHDLRPGAPWVARRPSRGYAAPEALELRLHDARGECVLAYRPKGIDSSVRHRPVAQEPAPPAEVRSADELFLIGEHLDQYRHPTRDPELYWNEALRRDPDDARCRIGVGRRCLMRGEWTEAADHFSAAIGRLTRRHPNPVTGEAHYHLGLVRRWQDRGDEAHALFYKATWDFAWRAPAFYALAQLACRKGDWAQALVHLDASLDTNRQSNQAQVLRASVLRRLGRTAEARSALADLLRADPLDPWALWERAGLEHDPASFVALTRNDAQTVLDVAFDYAEAGLWVEAIALLEFHHATPVTPVAVPNPLGRTPSTRYALAWLRRQGGQADWRPALLEARAQPSDYFFPSRLFEYVVLSWAAAQPGEDQPARFALGNFCFDRKRHEDAIGHWQAAVDLGSTDATVHRNLGLARWNVQRAGAAARSHYLRARELAPEDPRLLYEFDQLRKKLNEPPAERIALLKTLLPLVLQRDDASVELASLYNLVGRPEDALALLQSRRFHPWEGGEGAVLREYKLARLGLGQRALARGNPETARLEFAASLEVPANLGEAYHLLQSQADVHYWIGKAARALGDEAAAGEAFEASVANDGDFAEMTLAALSPLSFYQALSLRELGRDGEARARLETLRDVARSRVGAPAQIDYFATSLPNLLVFDENLQERRDAENHLLAALGAFGLGDLGDARVHLDAVRRFTLCDPHAAQLERWIGEGGG